MPSSLERRLAPYLSLNYHERDALDWLERRERKIAAGERVLDEDGPTDRLYVVGSGWLHSSVQLGDGSRQILRFYFVGDTTTPCSIAWEYSASTLTAVSDCTLYEVTRPALGRLFADHPRLAAMLYGLSAADHVAMCDRLASIGRMDGMDRIATLLLDLRSRLRIVDGVDGATFELPLTQRDLGDAVGLTKESINRALRAWEETGLIVRDGRYIRITDVAALAARVGFRDRLGHVAIDWLPPARSASELRQAERRDELI
jgi:CRP/FNR family transcriptional regulator, anaerobic regulatory protein